MKKSDQKITDLLYDAVQCACALHVLLEDVRQSHLELSLSGARREAGSDDDAAGSFWWMQNHYNSVLAAVHAANCIAANLERSVCELDDALDAADTPPRGVEAS